MFYGLPRQNFCDRRDDIRLLEATYRGLPFALVCGYAEDLPNYLPGWVFHLAASFVIAVFGNFPLVTHWSNSLFKVQCGDLDVDTQKTCRDGWQMLSATPVAAKRLDQIIGSDAAILIFPGGPSNANRAFRILTRILSIAGEMHLLSAALRIDLREEHIRESIIDPWLEKRLLQFAPRSLADVIVIMLDCGMRSEEVCKMRWDTFTGIEIRF
jgi:hypothetical protein